MALTIKHKVAFSYTVVIPSEDEVTFQETLKGWAKDYVADPFTLSPFKRYILITSLTKGVDIAASEYMKSGCRELIKEEMLSGGATRISPVQVN
ncbi:hypothetical protein [Pectobacterium phage PcaP1EGY]